MKLGEYNKERNDLSRFIQENTSIPTINVNKILFGNHQSQVHIYFTKDDYYKEELAFVELDIRLIRGSINVYSPKVIEAIKRSITKNGFNK